MILDGMSFQGSYHAINQDAFKIVKRNNIFVSVISDGLGSLSHSQIGSRAICDSVEEFILGNDIDYLFNLKAELWLKKIHDIWISKVGNDISNCYATFLLFACIKDRILTIRLGDGFISILLKNGSKVLFDKKETYLLNETDCFTEELAIDKVEYFESKKSELVCFLMSTDGFEIGDMSEDIIKEFTKEFAEGNKGLAGEIIRNDVVSWFSSWTGTDDKTLVYYLGEE